MVYHCIEFKTSQYVIFIHIRNIYIDIHSKLYKYIHTHVHIHIPPQAHIFYLFNYRLILNEIYSINGGLFYV